MRFKKDDAGKLVLDDSGDPIAIDEQGETIALDKVVSAGKHQRITEERDQYKSQAESLQAQIADLKKASGDKDDLAKKVQELTDKAATDKTEFETKLASRDKEYALDTALLKAGCRDTKAARAHIDMESLKLDGESLSGFDAEAFKKDRPYLFEATTTQSTAAASKGVQTPEAEIDAKARAAAGLPPKE